MTSSSCFLLLLPETLAADVQAPLLFSLVLLNSLTPPYGVLQVVYDVRGMVEKNRDTFRDDILNLLRESR